MSKTPSKQERLADRQDAMLQPGCFVILHPDGEHPDAGRVGKIISRKDEDLVVEFFSDDLIGIGEFSLLALRCWLPVPEFMVEEYEPRAKKRGWRIHDEGRGLLLSLGLGYTPATEGRT